MPMEQETISMLISGFSIGKKTLQGDKLENMYGYK